MIIFISYNEKELEVEVAGTYADPASNLKSAKTPFVCDS